MQFKHIRRVPAEEAIAEWRFYGAHIEEVIARALPGHYAEDVLTCIQRGNMQLWRTLCRRGVGVTEIQSFPRYRQLLIYMVAGRDVRDWLDEAHADLQTFARSFGCSYVEFHGRPGWEKVVEKLGYEHKMVRMKKRL